MAGFEYAYGPHVIKEVTVKNTVNITKGNTIEIESGEADFGVSGSTSLYGVAAENCNNAADGLKVKVIIGFPSTVFSVTDANARVAGATLDINGTYDGVTTSSNADLIVVEECSATEKTLVTFKTANTIFVP